MKHCAIGLAVVLLLLDFQRNSPAVGVQWRTVVQTGVAYPEIGSEISAVRSVDIGAAGQLMFHVDLATGSDPSEEGIYLWDDGEISSLARSGDLVPATDGAFERFANPILNEQGTVAFSSQLSGTARDSGLYLWQDATMHEVARELDDVGTMRFRNLFAIGTNLNDANQLAVRSTSSSSDGGSPNSILRGDRSGLARVAADGQNAPGGGRFAGFFSAVNPLMNDQGQISFWTGVDSPGATGIYRATGNQMIRIATRGQLLTAQRVIDSAFLQAMLPNGEVVFKATISGSSKVVGIYKSNGTEITPFVETGETVEGLEFDDLNTTMSVNSLDDLVFPTTFKLGAGGVTTSNDSAIVLVSNGVPTVLVREGDIDSVRGYRFRQSHGNPAINSQGTVVFEADTIGGTQLRRGIFASLGGEDAKLLFAAGDVLETSPGVTKSLTDVRIFNSIKTNGGDSGWRNTLNDENEFYFWAEFADGGEGLFHVALSNGTPGDFNGDGYVDGRDFLAWQRDHNVGDLADWQAGYGTSSLDANSVAVPEPAGLALACGCVLILGRGLFRAL